MTNRGLVSIAKPDLDSGLPSTLLYPWRSWLMKYIITNHHTPSTLTASSPFPLLPQDCQTSIPRSCCFFSGLSFSVKKPTSYCPAFTVFGSTVPLLSCKVLTSSFRDNCISSAVGHISQLNNMGSGCLGVAGRGHSVDTRNDAHIPQWSTSSGCGVRTPKELPHTHTQTTQKIGPSLGKVQEVSYVMKKILMYIQAALSGANLKMMILRGWSLPSHHLRRAKVPPP